MTTLTLLFSITEGHGALHDRLSLAMCEAVRPHLRAAGGLFARMVRLQTESADWML